MKGRRRGRHEICFSVLGSFGLRAQSGTVPTDVKSLHFSRANPIFYGLRVKCTTPRSTNELSNSANMASDASAASVQPVTDDTVMPEATISPYEEASHTLQGIAARLVDINKAVGKETLTIGKTLNQVIKKISALGKKAKKHPKRKPNKDGKPTGFAKPGKISPELAGLLGLNPAEEVPRTVVTSLLTKYVQEHGLQNPENKSQVFVDGDQAKDLFALLEKDPSGHILDKNGQPTNKTTIFGLQKYLKSHYLRPESTDSVAVAP